MSAVWLVGVGLLLGLRHATDADHLVVISTLVQREPRRRAAVLTAIAWGAGHGLTFLALGVAMIALGLAPPPIVDRAIEIVVGSMLTGLGLWHLTTPRPVAHVPRVGRIRAFAFGLVHGLAGSGTIALLAMSTVGTPSGAVMYLLAFAVGSIAGMALFTILIATPMTWAERRIAVDKVLVIAASVSSVVIGALLITGW